MRTDVGLSRGRPLGCRIGRIVLALAAAAFSQADDWPQYRGPNHDGTSTERILKPWPAGGPRLLWKKPLRDGLSSFAVSQRAAYTLVKRLIGGTEQECCIALDAATGQELWARPLGLTALDGPASDGPPGLQGGDGPRSTPTVEADRVYVFSSYMVLSCLAADTGAVVWQRDLVQAFGGNVIGWLNAASPLLEGELIFVMGPLDGAGQRLLAFHKADGSLAWRGPDERMSHASPIAATLLGVRQIIFYPESGLVAVLPQTGQVLWRYPFRPDVPTGASPVVGGDVVYCSTGYRVGAGAARIVKSGNSLTATQIWRKPGQLENLWSTPVCHEGFLYGLYGHAKYLTGPLDCVELATGTEMWSQAGFGPGQALLVDGHLLVLDDHGGLVLVRAAPKAYTEVSRFQALAGKTWNAPAISGGRLYARSVKEGGCWDVSVSPPPPLRLHAPVRQPDGKLQVRLAAADGRAIDPNRVARINIFALSELRSGLTNWTRLPGQLVLTNGLLQVADAPGAAARRRFYIAVETP